MELSLTQILFSIITTVLVWLGSYKVYEKAGEAGWKAIIPFYNFYVELDFLGYNPWLFLLMFVPIVNVVFSIMVTYKLAKAFDKGLLMTLGLCIVPFIAYPVLGFSDAQFTKPVK